MMKTNIQPGVVIAYDRVRGRGEIDLGDRRIGFGITSFDSGWPVRAPRLGDRVEVIFTGPESKVLYVRIPRTKE
ncbi:MAG TPA: hypothetical protein VM869_21940, partial [Enhygromyxa sp.]|nr:hypothetical protein [Enhygromyxa sp.]